MLFLDMVPVEVHREKHSRRMNWLGISAGKAVWAHSGYCCLNLNVSNWELEVRDGSRKRVILEEQCSKLSDILHFQWDFSIERVVRQV